MRIERGLTTRELSAVAADAAAIEAVGLDGVFTWEGPHDPFLPVVLAAQATTSLRLSTQIAVAFARSPMNVAQQADDLQRITGGRFALGLGTQVRAHVTRRFSMPWSHPVARMREYVGAVRAIWSTWNEGTELAFEGEFYAHTLMTPFFEPGPNPHGPPPILLAAVGPAMVTAAGAVADGLVVHPFHTAAHLAEVTWPQLDAGLRERGRGAAAGGGPRDGFEVVAQSMVATGRDDAEVALARASAAAQVGFYASTPAYRPVLEHHGMGDLQPRMRELTTTGRWDELAGQVPAELLDLVVTSGLPDEVGARLAVRNSAASTTAVVLHAASPGAGGLDLLADVVSALRSGA